jgi:hypothetical protein
VGKKKNVLTTRQAKQISARSCSQSSEVSNRNIMLIRSDRENQLKELKSVILLSVLLEDSISDSSSESDSSSLGGESDAEEIVGLSELYMIGNEIRYSKRKADIKI